MSRKLSNETFPFSRVAITGGTGTVASTFIKVLTEQCPAVEQIATCYRSPKSERVKRLPESARLQRIIGNAADPSIARKLIDGAEAVFHLAGWLANTDLPANRDEVFITNSLSTALLGRLCQQQGTKFVVTSSHSVYFAGEYEGHIREDEFAFREDFTKWIDAVAEPYYRVVDALIDGSLAFDSVAAEIAKIHDKNPLPFEPRIYDDDGYHIYCLTKLLAERFALDTGGVVLRLANVYGPGDDSVQAVGDACQRILAAKEKEHLAIRLPFKKLVPAYLGDIVKSLMGAAVADIPSDVVPLFTMASQESYLKEDALLGTVAAGLNALRGAEVHYDIEQLEADSPLAFTYDLGKLLTHVLPGEELTPFQTGLERHLEWLQAVKGGAPMDKSGLVVGFGEAT